jgi:hypothetical protein
MIEEIKDSILALEVLGIPKKIKDLENRPSITNIQNKTDISGLVPYTGATADVDLGTHNLTAQSVIETTPTLLKLTGGTLTGDLAIGSITTPKNLNLYSSLGDELAPAIDAAQWTETNGWAEAAGVMTRVYNALLGTNTVTGAGATPTIGLTYKIVITASAISGLISYTFGGVTGSVITATTITDYITANTAGKFILSAQPAATATITSISIKLVTYSTASIDSKINSSLFGKQSLLLSDTSGNISSFTGLLNAGIVSNRAQISVGGPLWNTSALNLYLGGDGLTQTANNSQITHMKLEPWRVFQTLGYANLVAAGKGAIWTGPTYNKVLTDKADLFYYDGFGFGALNALSSSKTSPDFYFSRISNLGIGYNVASTETIPGYFSVRNLIIGVGTVTPNPGTISVSGTTVTGSGTKFLTSFPAGTGTMYINGLGYTISSVANDTSLTLSTSPGTLTAVQYDGSFVLIGTSTTFTNITAGDTLFIDGQTARTVASVTSNTVLTVNEQFVEARLNKTAAFGYFPASYPNALVVSPGVRGKIGINKTTPTAQLHLSPGSATASTAPIKLESGVVLGTPEVGTIEFTTDDFFATITTGPARKAFILDDGTRLTSGKIPVATTNGRLIDVTAQTELTDELTTITCSAPGTPDYAIADLTAVAPYGFVSADEGQSVLKVIANLQTRVNELETKLVALGLLADAD